MLKPTDPMGLRPLTPVDAPAAAKKVGDAREESFSRLNQIALGKEYSATVLTRLQDGQFLVRIANAAARMPLPAGTQAGDRVSLTMIATQPRPTFLLGSSGEAGSTPTSVSDAGRLIDQLRQVAQRQGLPNRVLGGPPLLTGPPAGAGMAKQIAGALQNLLDTSGLFYESHVGEWAGKERSLETLMREPQAKFQQATTGPGGHRLLSVDPRALEAYAKTGAALPDELAATANSAQQADTVLRFAAQENPQAARMVNLQLDLLEHRRAAWEGEIWPGQKLVWEVSDETPESGKSPYGSSEGNLWQSKLNIDLPHLGPVQALIQLQGDHVRIQLNAAKGSSASVLRSNGGALALALDAAGTMLDTLAVKQELG